MKILSALNISILTLCVCSCGKQHDTTDKAPDNHANESLLLRSVNNTDKHYIKLDHNGNALINQNASWLESGNEQDGTQWHCIKDSKTGLIWEVKSDKITSTRAQHLNYTWHFEAHKTSSRHVINAQVDSSEANQCNGLMCTTQAYQNHLNKVTLCGITNWQVPTVLQFQTIVNHHATPRAIDTHYFPLTVNSHYWTQHSYAPDRTHAWYLYFSDGSVSHTRKDQPMFLRLVATSKTSL